MSVLESAAASGLNPVLKYRVGEMTKPAKGRLTKEMSTAPRRANDGVFMIFSLEGRIQKSILNANWNEQKEVTPRE